MISSTLTTLPISVLKGMLKVGEKATVDNRLIINFSNNVAYVGDGTMCMLYKLRKNNSVHGGEVKVKLDIIETLLETVKSKGIRSGEVDFITSHDDKHIILSCRGIKVSSRVYNEVVSEYTKPYVAYMRSFNYKTKNVASFPLLTNSTVSKITAVDKVVGGGGYHIIPMDAENVCIAFECYEPTQLLMFSRVAKAPMTLSELQKTMAVKAKK